MVHIPNSLFFGNNTLQSNSGSHVKENLGWWTDILPLIHTGALEDSKGQKEALNFS